MKEKRMVSVLIPKDGFTGLIAQKTGRNKVCPCGSGKKAKNAVVLIPSIIPGNRAILRHRKIENVDLTE